MSKAGQKRLQKSDVKKIVAALEAQGWKVTRTMTPFIRVEAWCPETNRFLCGFYWESETNGWRYDINLITAFSFQDLKSCILETHRVNRITPLVRKSWKEFLVTRSMKRWAEYRGYVASLFLRQDLDKENNDAELHQGPGIVHSATDPEDAGPVV